MDTRLPLVLTLLVLCLPAVSTAQDRFAALDSVITAELERGGIPGAAVAVIQGPDVVFSRTYGTTAIDSSEPIESHTLFRIGSITKTVTAVAVISLVESGGADLHLPIREYMPSLPPRLGSISLGQLLSHTGGVTDGPAWNQVVDPDALGRFCSSLTDAGLFHGVDGAWSYSNVGYALAGCAAAAAAGVTYRELIRAHVLDPLGMDDSTFDPLVAMARRLAIGHADGERLDRFSAYANVEPAGSMFSSLRDMTRLAEALANGGTLDGRQVLPLSVVDSLSAATVPATDIGWGPMGYGYGILSFTWAGQPLLMHGGLTGGHGADLLYSPTEQVAVVILTNRGAAYLDGTKRTVLETLVDLDFGSPLVDRGRVDATEISAWGGEYGLNEPAYAITQRSGALWLRTEGGEFRLEVASPDVLRLAEPPGHLPFPAAESPRTNYYSIIAVRDEDERVVAIQYALRVHPRWAPGG